MEREDHSKLNKWMNVQQMILHHQVKKTQLNGMQTDNLHIVDSECGYDCLTVLGKYFIHYLQAMTKIYFHRFYLMWNT